MTYDPPYGSENRRGLNRSVLFVILTFAFSAMICLLLFSSELVSWSYDLPSHPITEWLIGLIERWADFLDEKGISEAVYNLRYWVSQLY